MPVLIKTPEPEYTGWSDSKKADGATRLHVGDRGLDAERIKIVTGVSKNSVKLLGRRRKSSLLSAKSQ
jgi:hypothetical protein